jgi:hypothetical protein
MTNNRKRGIAMKMSSVTTEINASPEKIWGILTDASKYTDWDPGMISLTGKIAPSEKITIYAKISPKRAFKVTVSEFNVNRKMVWSSGMPLGLFKGVRTFTLEPLQNGQVRFSLQEVFSGPMLTMIGSSIPDMNPTFAEFAAALKKRAEGA